MHKGHKPKGPPKSKLSAAAKYAVLSAALPEPFARAAAGYAPDGSHSIAAAKPYGVDIQEIRKRLSDIPNFVSYIDLVLWFNDMKDNPEVDATNRVAAAKSIVKMQGYEAPAKMEIENRHNLVASVGLLKQLLGNGLNMKMIAEEKKRRVEVAEYTDISKGEDLI
jgi:hypothetical protein